MLTPILCDEGFEFGDVHVAFEGMTIFWIVRFVNDEVGGPPAARADVGIGGVEVHVAGNPLAGFHQTRCQNIFGGAALMGGGKMLEAKYIFHCAFEAIERACAGIGLIAAHERRPLLGAHCTCA